MPEARYKVITEGHIEDGLHLADVRERVAALFKRSPDKISRLFSGARVIIKKNLDQETALKYQTTLQRAGLICHIIRQDAASNVEGRQESSRIADAPQTEPSIGTQSAEPAAPEAIYIANKESVGLKPRLLAGLYTFFFVLCLYILLRLPIAAYLHFKHAEFFNGIEKTGATTGALITLMRQTNAITSEFGTFQLIALVLVVMFIMVFVPMRSGKTWGQKKMGLLVVDKSNQIARGFTPVILRLVGAGAAILTLGFAYLVPFIHPEKRSLADLISGTRQVQAGPPPKRPILSTLLPFALTILLSVTTTYPTDWLLTPHVPTTRETGAKKPMIRTSGLVVLPDVQITSPPVRPIRDPGPIVIVNWQGSLGGKAGSYPDDVKGLTDSASMYSKQSLVLQLFQQEEMRVVFTDNGTAVCLLEPCKRAAEDLFKKKEGP
jgi:uncharacterized RDD family membrane protein YckC